VTKRGRQEPTQAVILPYETSKGDQAVRLYNLTGRTCQEWQANLLRAIMATNEDGLWTHVKFGYSVPRRNGNSIAFPAKIGAWLWLDKNCRALYN
jgi:hypothetical protein